MTPSTAPFVPSSPAPPVGPPPSSASWTRPAVRGLAVVHGLLGLGAAGLAAYLLVSFWQTKGYDSFLYGIEFVAIVPGLALGLPLLALSVTVLRARTDRVLHAAALGQWLLAGPALGIALYTYVADQRDPSPLVGAVVVVPAAVLTALVLGVPAAWGMAVAVRGEGAAAFARVLAGLHGLAGVVVLLGVAAVLPAQAGLEPVPAADLAVPALAALPVVLAAATALRSRRPRAVGSLALGLASYVGLIGVAAAYAVDDLRGGLVAVPGVVALGVTGLLTLGRDH